MRSNKYHPRHLADAGPLYRTSLESIDRSGKVKMLTLEIVYLVQSSSAHARSKGWCTVEDLYRELEDMAVSPFESGRRGVSMRLLRYLREDLLIRRKIRGRLTEYKLSQRGEDRLIYFWRKFGLLTPPSEWESMGEEGRMDKELANLRFSLCEQILDDQAARLKNNRPLRTPVVRTVLSFKSLALNDRRGQETRDDLHYPSFPIRDEHLRERDRMANALQKTPNEGTLIKTSREEERTNENESRTREISWLYYLWMMYRNRER